eukprot:9797306-Lingulodinium_polyedra.AAC.1
MAGPRIWASVRIWRIGRFPPGAPQGWRPFERPRCETLRALRLVWAAREWQVAVTRRRGMAASMSTPRD